MPDKQGQDEFRAVDGRERSDAETVGADIEAVHSRRAVMGGATKLLVYSAPLIHLFRPSEALAASGVSATS